MKNAANARLEYIRVQHEAGLARNELPQSDGAPKHSKPRRKKNWTFEHVTTSMEKVEDEISPENLTNCVCQRHAKTMVCVNCKNFTYGRTSIKCTVHSNVTYLMDFMHCPNCLGPPESLHAVDLDYSRYQDITGKPATPVRRVANDDDDL